MPNWFDANPQMAQDVLRMLEEQAGRALSPQEIEQAKTALQGETLDPGALKAYASQLTGQPAPTTQAPTVDPAATAANKEAAAGKVAGAAQAGGTNLDPVSRTFVDDFYGPSAGAAAASGGTSNASPLFPDFQIPTYRSPTYRQAPEFSYGDFKLPTMQEAENQPGYQFGVQQGAKALQQSRAAQGLLRTGGTLKDILDYGRQAATQNYGNVVNQNLDIYNTNRAGAVGAYNTNYQTQFRDPNENAFRGANSDFYNQIAGNTQALNVGSTAFNNELAGSRFGLDVANARYAPQFAQWQTGASNAQRNSEFGYNADWQRYLDSQSVFYQNQSSPFAKYLSLAQLGAANA